MPNEDKWYISGPLGIGETEPYAPLVVSGEISLKSPDSGIHSLRFKRTDEDNRVHEWALWHMNKDHRKNALEIWEYKTDSSGKNCDGNRADGAMCDFRLTISEGGNVGIGAASPVSKLHIHGNYLNDGTGGFALDATDNDSPETYILRINPFALGDSKVGYQFQTKSVAGGTNVPLTFDHVGHVGIGPTEPAAKLTIQTPDLYGGNTLRLEVKNEPGMYYLNLNTVVTNGVVRWVFDQTNAGTNFSNVLAFDRGNVGIGTTDPKAKLDVSGTVCLMGKQALRGDDNWLRLNQEKHFSEGVHTPALFFPGSLNVGGKMGKGNTQDPGWGNAWFTGSIVVDGTLNWGGDKSDAGYVILGTLQICWGNFAFLIPDHNNSTDVAFPHSFGKLPHVLISLNDPGAHPQEDREQSLTCGVGARGVTVSGFKAICKTAKNEDRRRIICTWIAMGMA